jgi:aminoglycoside 6-adenylyltransferase
LLLFARDPEPYWAAADWLHHVGTPWLTFLEPAPDGENYERRVLFAGGLDVDFVPLPAADLTAMLEQELPDDMEDILRRGVRFLVDKDGFAERLQRIEINPPTYTPPTASEFLNLVQDFWYHTVWTGKHLRRGELWWAKSCCDSYMKELLRQMLTWHARASNDAPVDTWMRGRFLEEWADPRAVDALPEIFAHYDEEDVWRALLATMDLFHWVAVETAERLGYAYPSAGEAHATTLVHEMFSGRPISPGDT